MPLDIPKNFERGPMLIKRFIAALSLAFTVFLFAGCASTDGKKDVENAPAEPAFEKAKIDEFVLGVGDSIEVTVYRHDDLKKTIKIDSSGMFMYPLIGDVKVVGKGVFALRDEIRTKLSKYIVDPQVTITITSVQSQKILVLGEVKSPGVFPLEYETSVTEAISNAGGNTDDAKLKNVMLIRRVKGKPQVYSVDLKQALKNGDLSDDKVLQNGDIVYVPAVAIANVSWFMAHLGQILSPVVNLETGIVLWPQVKDVLQGGEGAINFSIPTN